MAATADSQPATFASRVAAAVAIPRVSWILLALLAAFVFTPRMLRSLWVDEANTLWIAHLGLREAIHRVQMWTGQSPLYSVISSFFAWDGIPVRDQILRIPSLIAVALAAYFVYRAAEEAIGAGAGFLGAAMVVLDPDTVRLGAQARPYACVLAIAAASSWLLVRWVERRDRRTLAAYAIVSAAVVWIHYLTATLFAAHLLYVLFVFFMERRRERWAELIGAWAVTVVLCLPLVPTYIRMSRHRHGLSFEAPPTLQTLTEYLAPSFFFLGLVLAAFILKIALPNVGGARLAVRGSFLFLLLCWWLIGPALFFAASTLSSAVIFLDRYLIWTIPARSLLAAYAGYAIFGSLQGRVWALLALLASTANPASVISTRHGTEELMPFVRIVRSVSPNNPPPLFLCSELPESDFMDWKNGFAPSSFLYTPLLAYPLRNPILPLPHLLSDDGKQYVSEMLNTRLARATEVLLVTHNDDWLQWMTARMQEAGFRSSAVQPN